MPQQDAADTCTKVRRPVDGKRVDVEWSLLKPSGVVGDGHKPAEMGLAAFGQSFA